MDEARPHTRRISRTDTTDEKEQRIMRLEAQVDSLKKAVRELADALHEELTSVDGRLNAIEQRDEEITRVQSSQGRAIKRQDEKLKRGMAIIAEALNSLAPSPNGPDSNHMS